MKEADRQRRNQERLKQCYGPFAQVVRAVLTDLENQGLRPRIQDAHRSVHDQLSAFNNGNSKVKFGFHNVTGEDDTPESLAVDVLDDDAPDNPSKSYLLRLAAAAWRYGLETGILWDLPESLRNAVKTAVRTGNFDAKVKIGWDPCHVQPTGIRISEARHGLRPSFPGIRPAPPVAPVPPPVVIPPAPEPAPPPYEEYLIKPGETLGEIAAKLYDDPEEFDSLPLTADIRLLGGQTLKIPLECPAASETSAEPAGDVQTYEVVSGDTLSKIAEKYYGDPDMYALIAEFNDLEDPDVIVVGQVLKIPPLQPGTAKVVTGIAVGTVATGGEERGGLKAFHAFKDGVRWVLTPDGVAIEGEGVKGTPGNPVTVTRIWNDYSDPINEWAAHYKVPGVLIVATIATESGGRPRAWRAESGGRGSMGLMQTLIGTARETLKNDAIDAEWLADPGNSIHAGTAYIAGQRRQTNLDPPKVATAYNAGSLRYNDNNRWKLHQNISDRGEPHCDRFVAFFNDAVAVLQNHPVKASVDYGEFYGFA